MRATRRRIAVLICVASAFICEIALAEPLYRFGVPPWQRGQSVDDIRRLYNPLLDYLGRNPSAHSRQPQMTLSELAAQNRNDRSR